MRISESIADVHYITNPAGDRTDVIVPLSAWEALLAVLEEMANHLEDQEDVALLRDWLHARTDGTVAMIPLADLEEELRRDGLLSS
ncbi:MAG: hypothetical protein BroJett021_06510 [Chloroflexota bacterium]|nr:hypothetical protein [Caldilinea sp.]GIK71663.1 MAG: hypothetical protein BroJett021_06510 [Chloroflexota bacterium]